MTRENIMIERRMGIVATYEPEIPGGGTVDAVFLSCSAVVEEDGGREYWRLEAGGTRKERLGFLKLGLIWAK